MRRASSKFLLPTWLKVTLVGLVALPVFLFALMLATFTVLRSSPAQLEFALEAVVSRVLARELQIGELLEAELGWNTYLLATDVSLANPAWAEEPEFARVGRLLLRINLPSIWRDGPVLITELALSEARVNLLAPDAQRASWDFWPSDAEPDEEDHERDPGQAPEPIFPVQFSDGRVDNAVLVFRDDERDITLSIEQLLLRESGALAPVHLELTGLINDMPLQVNGNLGPSVALLTWQDISLDLSASLGQLKLQASGTIDDLAEFSGPDLHLKIEAPRSKRLLDVLGIPEARDGPIHFEGQITDGHPGVAVEANGTLDSFHLQFSGKFDDPTEFDGVDLSVKVDGPSMAEAGMFFDIEGLPDKPYEVFGEIRRKGKDFTLRNGIIAAGEGRLSVDGRLPEFPDIDDWEVDVASSSFDLEMLASLFGVKGLPPIPYNIKGTLASTDEGVEVVDLRVKSAETELTITGAVGQSPDYFDTHFDAHLTAQSLKSSGNWFGLPDLPELEYEASAGLSLTAAGWQLSEGIFFTSGLKIGLDVQLDQLPEPSRLAAELHLQSDNLARTLESYGFESAGVSSLPVTIDGLLSGTPRELMIDEVTVSIGESQLRASGELGDPTTLNDLDFIATFTSPNLLELIPEVEANNFPPVPVNNRTHVSMSAEGIGIEDFRGSIGGVDINLKGRFNLEPPHTNSQFTLTTAGPDLGQILNLWLQRDVAAVPFDLSLDSRFDGGGVQIDRLEATLAGTQLNARFKLDDMEDPSSVSGTVELEGPSSERLAQSLGMEVLMPDAEYALSVAIKNSSDWIRLDSIALQWGKSDFSGSVHILPGVVPTVEADLHSKFVSLPFLLPNRKELVAEEAEIMAVADGTDQPMATSQLTQRELAERVIPSDIIDFGWLESVRGSFKYQIDEIYVSDDAKSSVSIDVSLADGVLAAKQLSWDGSFISGDTELTIRAVDEGAEIEAYVDIRRFPLVLLLGGQPNYDSDAFYRAKISTKGDSFREMAKQANGALVFKGGGGRMDNKGIDLILGDVLEEILDRLNPFSATDPYTKLICHAGAMSIKNGKATIAPGLVFRSDKMDIASGGSIDMHREKLDLTFNTRSRKGIGVSAGKAITPYFKIGGTLAYPRLALDAKGVAISGGAAVATAGLSILAEGLWDRWVATAQNPCEGLIDKISKEDKTAYSLLLTPAAE